MASSLPKDSVPSSQPNAVFALFPDLPAELRAEIWQWAIAAEPFALVGVSHRQFHSFGTRIHAGRPKMDLFRRSGRIGLVSHEARQEWQRVAKPVEVASHRHIDNYPLPVVGLSGPPAPALPDLDLDRTVFCLATTASLGAVPPGARHIAVVPRDDSDGSAFHHALWAAVRGPRGGAGGGRLPRLETLVQVIFLAQHQRQQKRSSSWSDGDYRAAVEKKGSKAPLGARRTTVTATTTTTTTTTTTATTTTTTVWQLDMPFPDEVGLLPAARDNGTPAHIARQVGEMLEGRIEPAADWDWESYVRELQSTPRVQFRGAGVAVRTAAGDRPVVTTKDGRALPYRGRGIRLAFLALRRLD